VTVKTSRFPWIVAGVFALFAAVPVQAQDVSEAERRKIEKVVREYLVANPEVIVEALRAYEGKRQAKADEEAQAAIGTQRAALENDPTSPTVGNSKADVTIVEFFDYRCGYCKKVLPTVQEVLKSDPNVRTVFKELPILGPDSQRAALAGQAVWNIAPDKYMAFHIALMQTRGGIDDAQIAKIAKEVGVDPAKLQAAMADPAVQAKLEKNLALAQKLNINGTPAFIVGDKLMPGAVDQETLKQAIADARGN
jgi:Protein-disulfide isomerase